MIHGKTSSVVPQIEALWTSGTLTGMTDAQLLGRFAGIRDATAELAFRELLHRHGPMVMGVCRQILGHSHDADDAFQATFLVLVRKAGSIRVGDSLAPWLYAVAYRTAQRARAKASRYRSAPVENLEDPMANPAAGACHFDLRPLLHEELNRLPVKYRDPIVLCHLEGKTHEEAARLLHWPVGTLSGRLSRGRELLRSRLKRRGLEVSPSALAAPWLASTPTNVALPLFESTVGAAIGIAEPATSASVLALTQGVLNTMLINKIKITALVVLLVSGVTGVVGVWGFQATQATNQADQAANPSPPDRKAVGPGAASKDAGKPFMEASRGPSPGMGFPNWGTGLKNSPNIQPRKADGTIRTSSMVLVQSPDRSALQAMSLELDRPRWDKFQFPPGTTERPVADDYVAALMIKGERIDRIAAFSPFSGNWVGQMLLKPAQDELNPYIGPGFALYQVGNDFYAFSSRRGIWSVLHLEGDEPPRVVTTQPASISLRDSDIEVIQGNRLYVFALKQGEWSKGVEVYVPPAGASSKGEKPAHVKKQLR